MFCTIWKLLTSEEMETLPPALLTVPSLLVDSCSLSVSSAVSGHAVVTSVCFTQ